MEPESGNNEGHRHQPEQRRAILDQAEASFPHQQPYHKRHRECPPWEADSGKYLERETNSSKLGHQDHERDEHGSEEDKEKEGKPETFTYGIDDRMLAYRRQPARHLDQENETKSSQHDWPQQLVPELRSGLGGCRHRPDLQKAANGGDDPER